LFDVLLHGAISLVAYVTVEGEIPSVAPTVLILACALSSGLNVPVTSMSRLVELKAMAQTGAGNSVKLVCVTAGRDRHLDN